MHLLAVAENIFFLVLVAIIGLIRWIMAASESAKNSRTQKGTDQPVPNAPVPRAPTQTEEERVRRFMEALGVPASNAPMPRQVKPPKPARSKVRPIDPFPKPRGGPWRPEPVVTSAPPPLPVTPARVTDLPTVQTERSVAPVFEVQVVEGRAEESLKPTALVRPTTVASSVGWAARLASAAGQRDAIVLREIFGAPRSLQPLDLHSLG
ncbi:MAG: hypothetical protein M3119_03215 [Verrucomicrobiota bacterium]|nr:hypothetical protein [Verrucomicrobiota bacterium]